MCLFRGCGSLWIMFYKLYRLLGVCVFVLHVFVQDVCLFEDVLVCVPKQGVAVRQLVNTLWGGCRSRTCPATIGRGIALDTGNKKVPFLEITILAFTFLGTLLDISTLTGWIDNEGIISYCWNGISSERERQFNKLSHHVAKDKILHVSIMRDWCKRLVVFYLWYFKSFMNWKQKMHQNENNYFGPNFTGAQTMIFSKCKDICPMAYSYPIINWWIPLISNILFQFPTMWLYSRGGTYHCV